MEQEGRGRVTHTNDAPRMSPSSPRREISFRGGLKRQSSERNGSVAPRLGAEA